MLTVHVLLSHVRSSSTMMISAGEESTLSFCAITNSERFLSPSAMELSMVKSVRHCVALSGAVCAGNTNSKKASA